MEIIAGCRGVYALELFDQDMAGIIAHYDTEILRYVQRFKGHIVGKDINANTVTHYLDVNLKTVKRIKKALQEMFPEAEIREQKVAIVSAIGSDMQVPGLLARTVARPVQARHQCAGDSPVDAPGGYSVYRQRR